MIVTETKIDSSYPNSQFSIPGYGLYRNDRKKGGGGILAYISNYLICKRIKPANTYKTIEPIVLEIQLKTKSFIVIGLYRPPKNFTLSYRSELEEELNKICNSASLQNKCIVLLGDLNLEALRPETNEGKLLLDLQETHEFECLISKPTRIKKIWDRISTSLIDVILTNCPLEFVKSGVFDPSLSDHTLVNAFMKERVLKSKTKVVTFKSCKNIDKHALKVDIARAPWHVTEVFDDIDDQSEFFSLLLKDIIDEHMPLKKMRVRERDVPYMTSEWKKAIRKRRKALRKYHKTKNPDDWDIQNKLRNEATRLRRKSIKEFWIKKSKDLKDKPQQFYKTFMHFLGSRKTRESVDMKLKVNNSLVTNKLDIAETMGDYFSSIADDIGPQREHLDTNLSNHDNIQAIVNDNYEPFQFNELKIGEVKSVLEDINPRKATGWDGIPPIALKIACSDIALPLCQLYNRCIRNSQWPKIGRRENGFQSTRKTIALIERTTAQ